MRIEEIEGIVLSARADPGGIETLLPLLEHSSRVYAGRSANEADRIRGFILASFAGSDLSERALPYILEELETGRSPYSLAGAARALHGRSSITAETRGLISKAIRRIENADRIVSLDRLSQGGQSPGTSAVAELRKALDAPASHCCGHDPRPELPTAFPPDTAERLGPILLEDQDGERIAFGDLLGGRAAVLAFFYTRCMNPEKCSLTVTRLGRLARLAEASQWSRPPMILGLTYDPAFDRSERLRSYGAERDVPFSRTCRLLRTAGPFEPVTQALNLAVGFGEATVNSHGVEALVKAPDGAMRPLKNRRTWTEEEALSALKDALEEGQTAG